MLHSKLLLLRSPAGFTLVELLLALVIFATIAGVIFASFGAIVDGVDKGRQSSDVYRVGRGAVQRMTQEIGAAVWFQDNPGTTPFVGEDGEDDGQPSDRLIFVTIPYRRFPTEVPQHELCYVAYYLADNPQGKTALFREEDCTPGEDPLDDGIRLELTDLATGLDITYYDTEGDHESWPPGGGEVGPLPCLVRVALTLQDPQQYERVFITTIALFMRDTCDEEAQG